jgi:hypothetical protein
MQCGTRVCSPIVGVLGTLPACCPADEVNACGAQIPMLGTTCLTATPGVADQRCPPFQVMGITLPGCCRPSGTCGVSVQLLGLGCNDSAPLGGPPTQRCGGDL